MENVKRTFFLNAEEAEQQRKITNNNKIRADLPHYELESGLIVWGQREPGSSINYYSSVK